MKKKPSVGRIGSVSHATMRPEDLIPTFLDVADGLRLNRDDRSEVQLLRAEYEDCGGDACEGHQGEPHDEREQKMLERLFYLLDSYAPPYCYFGAHEGDGSDYGWWVSQDALDNGVREGDIIRFSSNGMRSWVTYGCETDGCETRDNNHDHEVYAVQAWIREVERSTGQRASYRLVVSDHGNQTLYTRRGRKVWGVV